MLVTAPTNLVRCQGSNPVYYVLVGHNDNSRLVSAYPVKFSGLLGWEYDSDYPAVAVFSSMQQARKKTIIAKYYIEVME